MGDEICARVLLVEDNPGDAYLVEDLLSQIGKDQFDISHVWCINEAMATIEDGPAPHVVLLDLALPDSDGMDTIRAIQNVAPNTPIVVISGSQDPAAVRGAGRGAGFFAQG